jgi:hypothetical protein
MTTQTVKNFINAIEGGNYNLLKRILEDRNMDSYIDYNYNLPIHTSVSNLVDSYLKNDTEKVSENSKIIKLLLERGAQFTPSCFIKACICPSIKLIDLIYSKISIKCKYIYEQAFMEACKYSDIVKKSPFYREDKRCASSYIDKATCKIITHLHSIFPKYSVEPNYSFICLENLLKLKKYKSVKTLITMLVSDYGLHVLENFIIIHENKINSIFIKSLKNKKCKKVIQTIFNFYETIGDRVLSRYFEFAIYNNIFWFIEWLFTSNKINNIPAYSSAYFLSVPFGNIETLTLLYNNLENQKNKKDLLIEYLFLHYNSTLINTEDETKLNFINFILTNIDIVKNFPIIYKNIKRIEFPLDRGEYHASPHIYNLKKYLINHFYENVPLTQFQKYCSILFPVTYRKKLDRGLLLLNDLVFFKYTGNPYHSIGNLRLHQNYERIVKAKNNLNNVVIS